MSDDGCKVSFTGDQGGEYYVSCDQVKYLSKDNLTNSGSQSITLYRHRGDSRDSLQIYPQNYPRYSTDYSYHYITNISNVKFNAKSQVYYYSDYIFLFFIFLGCLYFLRKLVSRS